MKSLLLGIAFIVLLGFGGLVYRNAVEHPLQPIACPEDARLCPDSTSIARTGPSCTFAPCLPPNVSLANVGITFAVPPGFSDAALPDAASVAAYELPSDSAISTANIIIRRFAIAASSTALATIQQTAINQVSGLPVSAISYSSTVLGTHRFTIVSVERFEGVADTAYYLARNADVLRFDAIDRGITNLMDSTVDIAALPAHAALRTLLSTLQVGSVAGAE
jgi:hypothetical protein